MYEQILLETFFRTRSLRDQERPAAADYDTGAVYRYADLDIRSKKLAYYLKETLHLHKGDRVAFCARSGQWMLDAFYAMPLTGCVLDPYNCMLREQELAEMLAAERPGVLFYESIYREKVERFKARFPQMVFVVLDSENPFGDSTYEEIMDGPTREGHIALLGLEDIVLLLHTGGTTGTPKAAKISYRAVLFNTLGQITTYGITERDTAYVSFPFFHCAAWNSALPILLSGGKVVLKKKFDPQETLRMIQTQGLTFLAGSPSVFRSMAQSELFDRVDFSKVRMIRCGSASPALDLMEHYWAKNLLFYNGYGMTEAGPGILSLPASSMSSEQARQKAGSAGKPMLFSQVRLVDEDGLDVPVGKEGEILVKGNLMFSGYWENEAETNKVVRDGWLYSGDIARMDEDGFFYICGRKKNMFISGGENIYPMEIENVLLNHPAVADACVFGVKDEQWDEVGKAIVQIKKDAKVTAKDLQCFAKQYLSTIKIPKYVQFVKAIPRSDAGKLAGTVIAEQYGFPGI